MLRTLLPLENFRILDLSRLAAGNMVSHMFADFGADVIKVEKPGKGDDLRNWQVNDVAHWWACLLYTSDAADE